VDALARWTEVVGRPEAEVALDEAALLISAAGQPGLDVAGQLARLDGVASRVADPTADAVIDVVFGQLGLRGDRETYDDPANSFLDRVLDRGVGIPITLSVLLIEVGRRRGVRLEAVGMPGHFLARDPARPSELIDAFDGGRRLDRRACERLLRTVSGPGASLTPEMLATTGTHGVLARMLANLDRSYEARGDRRALGWVSDLRAALPGTTVGDRVRLAARLGALGRFREAAALLEAAAGSVPERAAERLRREALGLRARLN